MFACLYSPLRFFKSTLEEQSINALVELAYEHSPRVDVYCQNFVVLDIAGLGKLWGSPREVGKRLCRIAIGKGLSVRVAVAGTKTASLLVVQRFRGLTVVPPGAEAKVLSRVAA